MPPQQRDTRWSATPIAPADGRPSHDLVAQHGGALFQLATVLLADDDSAEEVVAGVLEAVPSTVDGSSVERRDLAQLVYVRCAERRRAPMMSAGTTRAPQPDAGEASRPTLAPLRELPPPERAAVALVWFGERDYRWMARTMTIPPPDAAQLLRSGLRRLAGGKH